MHYIYQLYTNSGIIFLSDGGKYYLTLFTVDIDIDHALRLRIKLIKSASATKSGNRKRSPESEN